MFFEYLLEQKTILGMVVDFAILLFEGGLAARFVFLVAGAGFGRRFGGLVAFYCIVKPGKIL